MRALLFSSIALVLLAACVLATSYDYARDGYPITSYRTVNVDNSVRVLKSIGTGSGAAPVYDFRRSTFRPITRVMTGPQALRSLNVPLTSESGAGLYVPYEFSTAMQEKPLDIRNRGGPSPYIADYGLSRHALQSSWFSSLQPGKLAVIAAANQQAPVLTAVPEAGAQPTAAQPAAQ